MLHVLALSAQNNSSSSLWTLVQGLDVSRPGAVTIGGARSAIYTTNFLPGPRLRGSLLGSGQGGKVTILAY